MQMPYMFTELGQEFIRRARRDQRQKKAAADYAKPRTKHRRLPRQIARASVQQGNEAAIARRAAAVCHLN